MAALQADRPKIHSRPKNKRARFESITLRASHVLRYIALVGRSTGATASDQLRKLGQRTDWICPEIHPNDASLVVGEGLEVANRLGLVEYPETERRSWDFEVRGKIRDELDEQARIR